MGLRGRLLCFAATAIASAAIASPALSAELTRAEYVDRAEALCEFGTAKGKPLLTKAFKEFKENKVVSAGPRFVKASELYTAQRLRLQKIPRPEADEADLLAWLKQLKIQNFFLQRTGEELAAAHRVQAQGFLSRFIHNGNLANDLVLGFGFKACLFDNRIK